MNKKHTPAPKLFYKDEFRPIINRYNNMDISTSRLCEIINEKADKIVSVNAELLEMLNSMIEVFEPLARENNIGIDAAKRLIKKATE